MSWMCALISCGLIAAYAGTIQWGAARVLSLVIPVMLVAAMTAAVSSLTVESSPEERRLRLNWWLCTGGAAASVVLGLAIAAQISSSWPLLWLGALAVSSPPSREAIRKLFPGCSDELVGAHEGRESRPHPDVKTAAIRQWANATSEPGPSRADGLTQVMSLTTIELCQLWRTTFWMLREVRSTPIVDLVALRAAVLDELERRRPDAVNAWLHSAHHIADGPIRYL